MEQTGTNLSRVKEYNQARVLDIIRTRAPVSRREIAGASGLRFQTVSNITDRLREAGVISEERARANEGHRRPVRLRLVDGAAYAVGVHLSRSALSVVVTNFTLGVLVRASTDVTASDGPSVVLPALCAEVSRLIAEAGLPQDKVLGVGIGMPGPPRPKTEQMLDPGLAGWSGYPLKKELEQRLGLTVHVDNDATAAALGERWNGVAADVSDFVYVYLGSGVGAGILVNHQVCRGTSGNAGEIGHIPVQSDGPPCYCGNRGCLEMYASPEGILREARVAALRRAHLPQKARLPFPQKVGDVIGSDKPDFRLVVQQAGDHLGKVIVGMTGVLDPELLVLGGPTTKLLGARFRESVAQALQASALPSRPVPRVEISSLDTDAGSVGAAALVLHDLYAPGLRRLSLI